MSADEIKSNFGNKIRVRVMGLLIENDKVLMINHSSLTDSNNFWSPPGGGVEYGESLVVRLIQEFQEEADLKVTVGEFLFGNEFLKDPLHAIELFFKIDNKYEGKIKLGIDPEMGDNQILQQAKFMTIEQIKSTGSGNYHALFDQVDSVEKLMNLKGHFYLSNIH